MHSAHIRDIKTSLVKNHALNIYGMYKLCGAKYSAVRKCKPPRNLNRKTGALLKMEK